MDFLCPIRDAGVGAVLEAKKIWNLEQDNEVREEFLSALMARNLHKALNVPVRTEVLYTKIYGDLVCRNMPVETANRIGGLRADIVICERLSVKPAAIVEVKIFDEGIKPSSILDDLHKADSVKLRDYLQIYAGVFVCETSSESLSDRQDLLRRDAPTARWEFSAANEVVQKCDPNKKWWWCFGSVALT
jgi:hypothetical protein